VALARVACRAQVGLTAPPVEVEAHLGAGLPCFTLVGLAGTEVKESKERVRAALVNSGFEFPAGRITVNLAPADLPKDGGRFDLAVAVAILLASGQLRPRHGAASRGWQPLSAPLLQREATIRRESSVRSPRGYRGGPGDGGRI